MRRRSPRTARHTMSWLASALPILLLLGGCGEPAPDEEAQPAAGAEVEEDTTALEAEEPAFVRPVFTQEVGLSQLTPDFPHDVHGSTDCSRCHGSVPGHSTHATVECSQCHAPVPAGPGGSLSEFQCLSCHHATDQPLQCLTCHDRPEAAVGERMLTLGVWDAPRERSLSFDHAIHASRECGACHQERPSLIPDESCSGCHDDHHRVEARCMTCHLPPPESTHDLEAHAGCGGSGCHEVQGLLQLASGRTGCLVCHQDKEEHEAGQRCSECHQVMGGLSASRDPPSIRTERIPGLHAPRTPGGWPW